MNLLSQLASMLGVEVEETVSASKRTVILYAVLAGFGVIAAVFLLMAAYLGLSDRVGPIVGALIIAGAALAIAAIVYAIAQAKAAATRREAARRRQSETTALATLAAAEALPVLLKSPLIRDVGLPLGAAIAAFYFANRLDSSDDEKP
jgi:hypothetical protein